MDLIYSLWDAARGTVLQVVLDREHHIENVPVARYDTLYGGLVTTMQCMAKKVVFALSAEKLQWILGLIRVEGWPFPLMI